MSAPAYFIAESDWPGDLWLWRENGDKPEALVCLGGIALRHPDLLARIRAAVEGEVREEWGVHIPGSATIVDACACPDCRKASNVRRTVITSAWQEVEG